MKRATVIYLRVLAITLLYTSTACAVDVNEGQDDIHALIKQSRNGARSGRASYLYSSEYHAIDLAPLKKTIASLGVITAESISRDTGRPLSEMVAQLFDASTAENAKSNEYRLDVLVVKGDRFVVRRAALSRDEYIEIRSTSYGISNVPLVVYAYDGTKTTRIEGKIFSNRLYHAVIIDKDRIFIPDILSFGIDPSLGEIANSKDWANSIIRKFVSGDIVAIEFEERDSLIPIHDLRRYVKWVANKARCYTLDRAEAGYVGYRLREEEYSDYVLLPSGRWYPRQKIIRHFAPIDQYPVLVREERYEMLGDSLDMDADISEHELNPALPLGASGTDFTFDPPRNFLVESDGSLKYLE